MLSKVFFSYSPLFVNNWRTHHSFLSTPIKLINTSTIRNDINNSLNPDRPSLTQALSKFRQQVSKMNGTPINKSRYYKGWPPPDRIKIFEPTKDSTLKRRIFAFNYREPNGRKRKPTLVICCGNNPVLYFSKEEFEALVSHLPAIKNQLELFRRRL